MIDELYNSGTQRFLSIGSVSEYGNRVGLLEETNAIGPIENNYVRGKVTVANYGLEAAQRLGRIFIHVRLFVAYGAGQTHNSLINQLFACSLTDKDMEMTHCDQYRDFIYITDAVEGIKKLICVDESGIVNLGSGKITQLKEFVQLFWEELGVESSRLLFGAHERPKYEQSQPKAYPDIRTLKRLTNWSPEISVEQGIKNTVEQFRLMASNLTNIK